MNHFWPKAFRFDWRRAETPGSQGAAGHKVVLTTSVCESIDLATPGHEESLCARLREIWDAGGAEAEARTLPRSQPVRDVVRSGPFDENDRRAKTLQAELEREFSEERLDFRVLSCFEPQLDTPRAFFGAGIFAPGANDLHVADLQFAWHETPRPEHVMNPWLGAGGGRPVPAAWYQGQRGIVYGFDPRWAPAVIERDTAPAGNPAIAALGEVVLFFGRLDAHALPVIEAHPRGKTAAVYCRADNPSDWWLRDGKWQSLEIKVSGGSARLWFRLTNRNGDVCFVATGKERRTGPLPKADPLIVVRGLILPEPAPLFGVVAGLLRGRASRWVVEFDGRNRLRSCEVAELHRSVVAEQGPRLAVWRHEPPGSWADRSFSLQGAQNLELAERERIELRDFPPSLPRDPDAQRRRAIHAIYRRKWCLLVFDGETAAFGWFRPGRASLLAGSPEEGTPLHETRGTMPDAWRIGLDWLNRAAHVSIGGRTFGLADYWTQTWKTRVTAREDRLDVVVEHGQHAFAYPIGRNERGPLGPLYIEYRNG